MSSVFGNGCNNNRCCDGCRNYTSRQNRRSCHNCECQCVEPMDIDTHRMFGIIDPNRTEELANHFLQEYYDKVNQIGWNAVLHLYAPDATICCNTNIYNGGHEFLNALSNEYIKRANFGSLGSTWSLIDESKMVITVFGEIQFLSFMGDCTGVGNFSDTFIIKAFPDETFSVVQHHFYFS